MRMIPQPPWIILHIFVEFHIFRDSTFFPPPNTPVFTEINGVFCFSKEVFLRMAYLCLTGWQITGEMNFTCRPAVWRRRAQVIKHTVNGRVRCPSYIPSHPLRTQTNHSVKSISVSPQTFVFWSSPCFCFSAHDKTSLTWVWRTEKRRRLWRDNDVPKENPGKHVKASDRMSEESCVCLNTVELRH